MKDTDTECVDDTTCKNVAAEGSAEDLKCSCKQGFHKKTPSAVGKPTCEAGTCAFFAAAWLLGFGLCKHIGYICNAPFPARTHSALQLLTMSKYTKCHRRIESSIYNLVKRA